VKVYLDENLSSGIARLLRDRGIDAISAHEVRRREVGDRAQLEFATAGDRAIVTANVVDFVVLARQAIADNRHHGGIIVVPASFRGDEFEVIADGIQAIVRRYPQGLAGSVIYLQRAPRS
jgi:hypothetical protein